ncbi:hypothetical protein FE257_002204 [Aspergillus nanangensis]|uniref:Uncharacterized protein n=1 Tax=Aspergillus nanangensis TaxID=2582783 RepID=A0AAD4CDD5_ASPNN|nr:hypothetical protein FE257_002204 [Aspergillus nanangensis]
MSDVVPAAPQLIVTQHLSLKDILHVVLTCKTAQFAVQGLFDIAVKSHWLLPSFVKNTSQFLKELETVYGDAKDGEKCSLFMDYLRESEGYKIVDDENTSPMGYRFFLSRGAKGPSIGVVFWFDPEEDAVNKIFHNMRTTYNGCLFRRSRVICKFGGFIWDNETYVPLWYSSEGQWTLHESGYEFQGLETRICS